MRKLTIKAWNNQRVPVKTAVLLRFFASPFRSCVDTLLRPASRSPLKSVEK